MEIIGNRRKIFFHLWGKNELWIIIIFLILTPFYKFWNNSLICFQYHFIWKKKPKWRSKNSGEIEKVPRDSKFLLQRDSKLVQICIFAQPKNYIWFEKKIITFCCWEVCWPCTTAPVGGRVRTWGLDSWSWIWLLRNNCNWVGWKFSCFNRDPLCWAIKAGCWSGGNWAIFCLNSKTILFCSSVNWVIAAAVWAAAAAAWAPAGGAPGGPGVSVPGVGAVAGVEAVVDVAVVVVVPDVPDGKEFCRAMFCYLAVIIRLCK